MALLSERLARLSLRALGWQSRTAPAVTGAVHWLEAPGGGALPTTVLLHGFNSSAGFNGPLLQALRPHVRRLVAPDLPGHGFSEAPERLDGDLIYLGLRDALDRALDAPAVLVGNSMGAALALRYAVDRPALVQGLALVSPGGAPLTEHELAALQRTFTIRSHAEAVAFIDRLLVRRTALRPIAAASLRRGFARPALRQLLTGLGPANYLTADEVRSLAMPVLLLWGAEERVLPSTGLAFFREHLPPHARIEVVEGVGHSPQVDDCEGTARRLVAFLRELR
jgi:pimeloyl-ACP methyl ester carboxylesterase